MSTTERPSPFPWPPVLLAAAFASAFALGRLAPLPWPGQSDLAARVIGLGLGAGGLALIAWAAWTMSQHRTTVMPHKGASSLVTSGPFRFRRNPIYIGDMLLMLGAAELTHNIWLVILVPIFAGLVTLLAILPEERHLEARFGDDWRAYAARTRRLL